MAYVTRDLNNKINAIYNGIAYNLDNNVITEEIADDSPELQAFLSPPVDPNAAILVQIASLEAKTARSLRDAILRQDTTFLGQYDSQIEELRKQIVK